MASSGACPFVDRSNRRTPHISGLAVVSPAVAGPCRGENETADQDCLAYVSVCLYTSDQKPSRSIWEVLGPDRIFGVLCHRIDLIRFLARLRALERLPALSNMNDTAADFSPTAVGARWIPMIIPPRSRKFCMKRRALPPALRTGR